MKQFLIIPFIFLTAHLNAQIPATGSYITNISMGAFHGTWQWVNGTDTIKIYLTTKKTFFNINGGYNKDMLVGWHIYKQGSIIVESSYNYINNIGKSTFLGSNQHEPQGVVTGTLTDISKSKYGDLTLTLNTAGNQLTWNLKPTPGLKVRTPSDPPFQPGFTLPQNMVLIKQ